MIKTIKFFYVKIYPRIVNKTEDIGGKRTDRKNNGEGKQ